MTEADDTILAEAAAWHLAIERDDVDWDRFTEWLEADPRHRAAYAEIAAVDAALKEHRESLQPLAKNADATPPARRWALGKWPLWAGGALAASLAALLIMPQIMAPPPATFVAEATPQTIALEDGSSVVLAPHSRLTVAGRHHEQLAIEGGAYFAIRHDPKRSLSVRAGSLEIGDVGTRFDVQAGAEAVRVEVSEGRVEVRSEALAKPVELLAGRRMLFDPARRLASVSAVMPDDVGEWREGRLTFDATPLALVAGDLSRYTGITVSVPSGLAGRRFSGTLLIRNGDSAVRDLAQLMGLQLSRDAGAYRLSDPG